jgi:hypothetical protein
VTWIVDGKDRPRGKAISVEGNFNQMLLSTILKTVQPLSQWRISAADNLPRLHSAKSSSARSAT